MTMKDGRERALEEPRTELDRIVYSAIGAAIEVHRTLGPGYLEGIYERALCLELEARGISYARQVPLSVDYKGRPIGDARMDLVVEKELVLELKTVDELAPIHVAQLLSYLKGAGLTLGLLINFGAPLLRDGIRRVIRSR